MKSNKILALLLVFVMCAALVLTSCSKVSKKDVEKDPAGENAEAVGETLSAIGGSFSPIAEPFDAVKDSGTVEITWKNDDIGIDASASFSYDRTDSRFYGDVGAKLGESDVKVKVYGDEDDIAVAAPGLFEGAYGINLRTLADDISKSELFEGVDVDEISESIDELIEMRDKMANSDDTKLKEECTALLDKIGDTINEMDHTVEKKDVKAGGKSVSAIVTEFKFTQDDFVKILEVVRDNGEDLFDEFMKLIEGYASYSRDIPSNLDYDKLADEIDKMIGSVEKSDFEANVMFALDAKTGQIVKIEFSLEAEGGKLEGEFDFGCDIENYEEITGSVTIESDELNQSFEIEMKRSDDSSKFSESIDVGYTSTNTYTYTDGRKSSSNETLEFSISFENDKNAKTYELNIEGSSSRKFSESEVSNSDSFALTAAGALDYDSKSVTFGLDTLTVEENGRNIVDLEDFGLTIKVTSGTDFEKVPEYKNIMTMDKDEIQDLGEEVQENSEDLAEDFMEIARGFQKYFG